jgi:hypothetical protein
MPNILVTCPVTGKPILTEMHMDQMTFEAAQFQGNRVQCPHCGQRHPWGKEEAYLEGEEPKEIRA